MRAASLVRSLASLTLGACLVAGPAHAQFRLPKPRVPNPLNRASSGNENTRTPTYDERVLEITDARLASLIRGLQAEQRQRPALAAAYQQNADARARAEAAGRDQRSAGDRAGSCVASSPEYRAVLADSTNQLAMIQRIQALQAKGDYTAMQVLGDSMAHAAMRRDSLLAKAQQRCTAANPADTASSAAPDKPAHSLGDSLHLIGAAAAGLTPDQYSVLRERVAAFLSIDEADLRNSLWVYGNGEMQALKAKKGDLQRYQATLTEE